MNLEAFETRVAGRQDPSKETRVRRHIGDSDVLRFLRPRQDDVPDGLSRHHVPRLRAQLDLNVIIPFLRTLPKYRV